MKQRMRQLRDEAPQKRRAIVAVLVAPAAYKRRREQRELALQLMIALCQEIKVAKRRRVIYLPKNQYAMWHRLSEGLSETAATEKWNRGRITYSRFH